MHLGKASEHSLSAEDPATQVTDHNAVGLVQTDHCGYLWSELADRRCVCVSVSPSLCLADR